MGASKWLSLFLLTAWLMQGAAAADQGMGFVDGGLMGMPQCFSEFCELGLTSTTNLIS